MSTQVFPLAVWQSGTNENSIPANDNALRVQALMDSAIGIANSAPGTPTEDDQYVVGTAWGGFSTDDVVVYKGGTWLGYLPFEGWVKVISGDQYYFDGSDWTPGASGGGVEEAPIDGTPYSRQDAGWVPADPVSSRNTVTALSIASGVVNVDYALGDYFTLSLTANVTSLTFSNLPGAGNGASLAFRIQQDGSGSRTLALPSSFKAITGSDTAVQSAPSAYTILHIETFDNGTRWEYTMKAGAP